MSSTASPHVSSMRWRESVSSGPATGEPLGSGLNALGSVPTSTASSPAEVSMRRTGSVVASPSPEE